MLDDHRYSLFWLTASCSGTIVLLYLCLTPAPPQIDGLLGWDKFQHATAFGFLTFLYFKALQPYHHSFRAVLSGSAVAASLLGGLIEILQSQLTLNRKADWIDFAADTSGAIITMIILLIFRHIRGPV